MARLKHLADDALIPNVLEEEALAWVKCERCPLAKDARRVVYGHGLYRIPLFILGLSPGKDEDNDGIPFVGASGQFIRKHWKKVGVDMDQFFVTNTVGCRPPGNRTPAPLSELNVCRPRFDRAIEILQPRAVLVLGNIAMAAMTGRVGIEKSRGKVYTGHYFDSEGKLQDVDCVTAVHPSALIREHTKTKIDNFRSDLKLALETVRS